MIPVVITPDRSGWILNSIKSALRWWLIKTTGPMQRIRYKQKYSKMTFSMLFWVDSAIVDPKPIIAFQETICKGKWKIC